MRAKQSNDILKTFRSLAKGEITLDDLVNKIKITFKIDSLDEPLLTTEGYDKLNTIRKVETKAASLYVVPKENKTEASPVMASGIVWNESEITFNNESHEISTTMSADKWESLRTTMRLDISRNIGRQVR